MRFQFFIASVLALSVALITGGYVLAQSDSRNGWGEEGSVLAASAAGGELSTEGVRYEDVALSNLTQNDEPDGARLLFRDPDAGPFVQLSSSLPPSNVPDVPVPYADPYLDPRFLFMEAATLGLEVAGPVIESEAAPGPESGESSAVPSYHIVEPGDTLWAIGLRYETTWPVLAAINALPNPDLIFPGQIITLPQRSGGEIETMVAAATETAQEEAVYTIQAGDTLSGIGERFGVHWSLLAHWNGIANPDLIYAGDRLTLVEPAGGPFISAARLPARPATPVLSVASASSSSVAPQPLSAYPTAVANVSGGGPALQSGIATWYGPGFEGNLTACGQVYVSSQLTAASNSLPCGSVVTVTNQYTGASVTVTITDRGGFTHALDLSYAAFSAIANPSAGVVPVIISAAK